MQSGMTVVSPNTIFGFTKSKMDFDKINAEALVHEWKEDLTLSVLKNDGEVWQTRIHSKQLSDGSVCVIFQWREERVIPEVHNRETS